MGRQSRRLVVRLAVGASFIGTAAYLNTRWQLRAGSAVPLSLPASSAVTSSGGRSRHAHLRQMEASSDPTQEPFDVLVVGGGVQGLYTAVDAAQRGLHVALVEAADFGSGVSSQGPSLQAGAFPFVQRAVRQRDTWWLRRAAETLREITIWENVCPEAITAESPLSMDAAPHSGEGLDTHHPAATASSRTDMLRESLRGAVGMATRPAALHTLIPALHFGELVEFSVTACLCTLLSPFCGPWRPHAVVRPQRVADVLPGMDTAPQGGVRASDLALHGITATCALLRTAEAMGVVLANHTPLRTLSLAEGDDGRVSGRAHTTSGPAAPLVVATVEDALTRRSLTLRTRTIINCAEAWADQVRALCPGNVQTTTPAAFSHYAVQSYVVAVRDGVQSLASAAAPATSVGAVCEDASSAVPPRMDSLMDRLQRVRAESLQVCSTLYSFSAVFALPWANNCVLLGPCFSPLPQLPVMYGSSGGGDLGRGRAAADGHETVLISADGFRAQQERIRLMLKSCGIAVPEPHSLLSCLSHIVPVLAAPQDVPWTRDVMRRGFHIDVATRVPLETPMGAPDEPTTTVWPFVHVYGGTMLQARLVAAAAVDAALEQTHALDARKSALASLHSRTAQLALSPAFAPQVVDTAADTSVARRLAEEDPMARLRQIAVDTRAERITDILFRRAQIGYTSPGQAMQAAAFMPSFLPALAQASQSTKTREVRLAERAISGAAIYAQKE